MSGEEPAPQMAPVESPQMISTVKLPMLKKGEYTLWSMRMEQYLTNTDYGLWQVIMNGDEPVQTTKDENGVETEVPPKTAQAILARQKERKAKSIMLLAIPDEYQLRFHTIKDAKSLWAAIKSRFGGNVESKKMQKNVLKQQFENFSVSDTEGLDKAYDSSLLRNKEKLEEIAITTVNAECSAIIMNKVPEKLEDPGKISPSMSYTSYDRTSALADSGATLDLLGKDELVYYADKSEKNKDKNCVHAISIIDFSKEDPFSGSPTIPSTNSLHPSSSPMKTSDNIEKFTEMKLNLLPLNFGYPPGNDDSTLKKEFHEVNFQVYSHPLFEFDESFKSSNVNPLFEEKDKDVEISSFSTLTSPEASELEDYLEKDSIPPGINLTLPSTLEVLSSNPTFPTLTGEKVWKTPMFFSLVRFVWKMMNRIAIRKKIICLLAAFLHKKPKTLSRPQEIEEIKEQEEEVSSDVQINTIVMPIRITFDNPIDFNDHFSKPKDLKKDLTISFDSTTTSILPHPLLDSDSPFTAELSASVTLNSLGNEDKVFKPGILVYHVIHDKNLVTLEENSKENISSGTLLVFKEPSILLPTPEPPDECLKNVVLNFYQSKKTFPLNVEDVNSFAFIIWTFLPFFTYTKASL
ncbi:hypothetical protein Tco_0038610 [Tanacetum coccineum]